MLTHQLANFSTLLPIFIDVSSISSHQALEQETVLSLYHPVLCPQLISVAIIRHNAGKDWHAILLSVSIKDFTLNM